MLRITRAALLRIGGYEMTVVPTDNEVMDLLETRTFDLVLIGQKTDLPTIDDEDGFLGPKT
jgi:hypothetical protein